MLPERLGYLLVPAHAQATAQCSFFFLYAVVRTSLVLALGFAFVLH